MIICRAGVKKKKGNEEMITGEVMVGDTPRLYGALLRGKKKEREKKIPGIISDTEFTKRNYSRRHFSRLLLGGKRGKKIRASVRYAMKIVETFRYSHI